MTVSKILAKIAAARAEYFAGLEPTGDYYVNDQGDPFVEPGGFRAGGSANSRGSSARPVRWGWRSCCACSTGRHPETGKRLVRVWKKWTRERIAGHDLCWSAPSSVSTTWAATTGRVRTIIQTAHHEAVAYAFAHVETHAKVVRRRDTTRTNPETGISPVMTETAAGLIAATYRHHTARQTKAQASVGLPPDPQLHTHVLVQCR